MFKVITRVVLSKRSETVPYLSVGKNHFKTQNKFACVAIFNYVNTACVGGEISPDCAASFCSKGERKEAIMFKGSLLRFLQDNASLCYQSIIGRINLSDFVHPFKA